jgi:hypothetical protein
MNAIELERAPEHGELLKLRRPSTQAALNKQSWGLG